MIRYTKLYDGAGDLTQGHIGDAGWDIRAANYTSLYPGQTTKVATGIALEIPDGWAVLMLPRSGLASKHGITLVNSPGLIDSGYRGEVFAIMHKLDEEPKSHVGSPTSYKIEQGERIAQLVPFRTERMPFQCIEFDRFNTDTERGVGGLGSTGR